MRYFLGLVLACAASSAPADVVRIAPAEGDGPAFGIEGTIVDYTGREVVIRPARGGPERRFSADRVVELETTWPPGYQEGRDALARQDFEAAERDLLAANRGETRPWARRVILGELARALVASGRVEQAGEVLLAILASDATSPHFDLLPLAWSSDAEVPQTRAEDWLTRGDSPPANLLGASYLLGTARQQEAVATLRRLTSDADPRIAALAEAQLWRTRTATADPSEVRRWLAAIERLPAELRPGPYFVVGTALQRHGQYDDAALAFLRVPIHRPLQKQLTARALLEAAEALREAGHPHEGLRIAQEVATAYTDTPYANLAEKVVDRLQAER